MKYQSLSPDTSPRQLNEGGKFILESRESRVKGVYLSMVARIAMHNVLRYGMNNGKPPQLIQGYLRSSSVKVASTGNFPPRLAVPDADTLCDSNMAIADAMTRCGLDVFRMLEDHASTEPTLPSFCDDVWNYVVAMLSRKTHDTLRSDAGMFIISGGDYEHMALTLDNIFTDRSLMPMYTDERRPDAIKFLTWAMTADTGDLFVTDDRNFLKVYSPGIIG